MPNKTTTNTDAGSDWSSDSPSRDENMPLEDQLTNRKLQQLQQIFEEADEDGGGGLDMEEFRTAMRHAMGDHLTDDDLDRMFMKVDTNCDGTVDWDEYLNYMLLEYTGKDAMHSMVMDKPLPRDCRPVHNLHDFQRHHDSIVKVELIPNLIKVKNAIYSPLDRMNGRYMTMTKEGVLNFWNMELGHLKVHRLEPPSDSRRNKPASSSIWVTDIVCMSNFNMIGVATSSANLTIYEIGVGGSIRQNVQITDMEIFITAMDYWIDPNDPTHSLLIWGDGRGNICALRFYGCEQVCVLHPSLHKHARPKLKFTDILNGKLCGLEAYRIPAVHNEFVLQVKYCPALGYFVSCCGDASTSLFMGDLHRKRQSYFRASKGTTTFDYCRSNNIVVSAGKDAIIRVWNPYVIRRPVMLLQGHTAAITHLIINQQKEHIISISESKDIHIYDLETQTCIQSIFKKWVGLGQRSVSGAYFNQSRQALILATNQLAIWEHMEEELKSQALNSHKHPMTCILYNSLFRQVVTGSVDSLVCVWDVSTGERTIQFAAHKKVVNGVVVAVEISTMAFDPTLRRLITGGRDGSVKFWNFNNGACLRELEVVEKLEVTGIVCPSHRVITAGWNHRLTVYMDTKDEEDHGPPQRWPLRHKDDILCLAFCQPSHVASASYDGDILIWSLETGYVTIQFNSTKGSRPCAGVYSGRINRQQQGDRSTDESPLSSPVGGGTPSPGPDDTERHYFRASPTDGVPRQSPMSRGARRTSLLPPPPRLALERQTVEVPTTGGNTAVGKSVEKILFLETRRAGRRTATLVSAESGGWIRFWSIHQQGGILGQWNASHKKDKMVMTMVTDAKNEFLITGDSSGYVKVWDILDYCHRAPRQQARRDLVAWHKDRGRHFRLPTIDPSLRQKASDQKKHTPPSDLTDPARTWMVPPLLTSFRGHLQCINDLCYLDKDQMIATCSEDCSIRIWTLEGLYIGLFGQSTPLGPPMPGGGGARPPKKGFGVTTSDRKLPPDVRRVASATTLKMFYGGTGPLRRIARNLLMIWIPMLLNRKVTQQKDQVEETPVVKKECVDEPRESATGHSIILGKSYKSVRKHQPLPKLEQPRIFKNQCAVYSSLPYFAMEKVEAKLRPPQTILDIQDRQQTLLQVRRHDRSKSRSFHSGGHRGPRHPATSHSASSSGNSEMDRLPTLKSNRVVNIKV